MTSAGTGIKLSDAAQIQLVRKKNAAYADEIDEVQQRIDQKFSGKRMYTVIDKIGEGTFSSVYRAIDECAGFLQENDDSDSNVEPWWEIKELAGLKEKIYISKRWVAIKRIYQTSSPTRLKTEIEILRTLGGKNSCAGLLHSFRQGDQVLVVMPFFEHQEFRVFMHMMKLDDIRYYMKRLLEALSHVHRYNIVHRDIKPANFLYDAYKRKGMLVDFGLAQYQSDLTDSGKYEISSVKKKKVRENRWIDERTGKLYALPAGQTERTGYFPRDPRPAFKAPRAGTRGFRAPEVLFRYAKQTVAIDVWAAGVIMLSLITKQFPVFNSQDDLDGLAEVACLYGNDLMTVTAQLYGRVWYTNIPTVPNKQVSWKLFCYRFNPKFTEQAPEEMFELLNQLLDPNAWTRITASDALRSKFLCTIPTTAEEESAALKMKSGKEQEEEVGNKENKKLAVAVEEEEDL